MYGRYLPEVSEVHCRGKGGKSMKKQRKHRSLSRLLAFVLSVTMLAGLCPQGVSFFGMSLTLPKVQAAQRTLSNPRIVKDSSMEAGQKVTWDCVYFGSYPQTEVVESGSEEEAALKEMNRYYVTKYQSVSSNVFAAIENASYDANGDATVGGTKYRRRDKVPPDESRGCDIPC